MATPPAKVEAVVEVIGSDVFGQQFFENGETMSVYPDGLSIRLKTKLARDSEVIVRDPETNAETLASVLGQIRNDADGTVYALCFLNPAEWHWRAAIAPGRSANLSLQCSVCHSVSSFSISGISYEMFQATRELTRACEKCKSPKVWRESKSAGVSQPTLRPSEAKPGTARDASLGKQHDERRKTKRTPMKAPACIRCAGVEVIVQCEDVSKGGFRFVSNKEFPEGTRVEAAVPYTKFSNNIFSHAVVAYCRPMSNGQFRHGMAYIKASGSIPWNRQE